MVKIIVQNTNITIINIDGEYYVSITDQARPQEMNIGLMADYQRGRAKCFYSLPKYMPKAFGQ